MNSKTFINIYREQRHDFMNHIQIILGYLQIDKSDAAMDYIHRVIDKQIQEKSIFQLDSESVLALLELKYKLKRKGKSIHINIDDNIKFININEIPLDLIEDTVYKNFELSIKRTSDGKIQYIISEKEDE